MNADRPLRMLTEFSPAQPSIDRDDVMFRAGQASARVGRVWKSAVAVLILAQFVGWGVWWSGPPVGPGELSAPMAISPIPPALAPSVGPPDPATYRALVVQWSGENPPAISVSNSPNSAGPVLSVSAGHRGESFD